MAGLWQGAERLHGRGMVDLVGMVGRRAGKWMALDVYGWRWIGERDDKRKSSGNAALVCRGDCGACQGGCGEGGTARTSAPVDRDGVTEIAAGVDRFCLRAGMVGAACGGWRLPVVGDGF